MAALHRSGYGINQAYSNRYQFFPGFFIILLYVQFIKDKIPSFKVLIPILIVGTLMYWNGFKINDKILKKHKMSLIVGIKHYAKTGRTNKLSYSQF